MKARINYQDVMMYIQEQEKENRRLAKNQGKNTEASDMVKQVKATKAKAKAAPNVSRWKK